ncbi:MAG: hypothetical protein VYA84_16405 [Planctomycetota bacterium]|nr:hypothetical protein [Planctomycetota bacterium]
MAEHDESRRCNGNEANLLYRAGHDQSCEIKLLSKGTTATSLKIGGALVKVHSRTESKFLGNVVHVVHSDGCDSTACWEEASCVEDESHH